MTAIKKTCFKCGKTLVLTEFYRYKQMADGHLNKCKTCTKDDAYHSRHVKHRERVLSYDRERAKNPERKAAEAIIYAKWKEQNPERRSAQTALGNAVKKGSIKKLPCFVCGISAEAHHPDYSSPLDVVWLCSSHHKQAHSLARNLYKGS